MDKDLLLKDGLLFLVFVLSSTATVLVGGAEENKMYVGLGLYGLATLLICFRTYLKKGKK